MKNDMGLLIHIGEGEAPKGFTHCEFDLERFPYPLRPDSVHICLLPHALEHVKPWLIFKAFNELWRVIKPEGQLAIATAYAGSPAWWGDPSHCTGFNERSFFYLTPSHAAFDAKKSKPWAIEKGNPVYQVNGNIECVLRPVKP